MKKCNAILLITLVMGSLMLGSTTIAAPDKVTEFLLNEPASMLDIGTLRTKLYFEKISDAFKLTHSEEVHLITSEVIYDWSADRFHLSATIFTSEDNQESAIDITEQFLAFLRADYFSIKGDSPSVFSRWFNHNGYTKKTYPDFAVLDEKFYVAFRVYYYNKSDQAERTLTKSALISAKVFGTGYSIEKE